MKNIIAYAFIAVVVLACSPEKNQETNEESADSSQYQTYGAEWDGQEIISLTEFTSKMSQDSLFSTGIEIEVLDVCQNKGCWMTAKLQDGQEMRITFKDYGFFVPKDISGKKAVIYGSAAVKNIPEDVRKHYAEESGKSKDEVAAISGDQSEVSFVANGVQIFE